MKMKAIMKSLKIFTLLVALSVRKVFPAPISVPVDNNYSYNSPSYASNNPSYASNSASNSPAYASIHNTYDDNLTPRVPNSHFNRLPPNSFASDAADIGADNADYDYDEQQSDKPVPVTSSQQQLGQYGINTNYVLTQNRVKKKKAVKRPCIPIQSFGSSLFSNRLKRDIRYQPESVKTLGYLFGGLNDYNYAPYYQSGASQDFDNVKPQYDQAQYNRPQYVQPQYDTQNTGSQIQYQPYGGYPCVPVSVGNKPGGGSGLFGGGSGLFGGGGPGGGSSSIFGSSPSISSDSSGLLSGLFGQGGLLDFGSPGPLAPAGIYQGSGNYPQTVIINRPPLFGNPSNFNRPPSSSSQDNFLSGSNNQNGFWGTVVNKLKEFV